MGLTKWNCKRDGFNLNIGMMVGLSDVESELTLETEPKF